MMIYIKRQSLADDHLLPLIPCHHTPLTLNKPNCHHFCHCNVLPSCFRMCFISSIQFLNARAPVCLYVCACLYVCVCACVCLLASYLLLLCLSSKKT